MIRKLFKKSIITKLITLVGILTFASCTHKKSIDLPHLKSSKTLYTSGLVNLRNRTADILPFYLLDEDIDYKQDGNFSIEYLDSSDNILYKIFFPKSQVYDMPEDKKVVLIDQDLPFYPEVRKIRFKYGDQILKLRHNNKFITTFEISKNSPEVSIQSPNEGVVTRNDGVRWIATDKDNDLYNIMISYSEDNGRTWEPLTPMTGINPNTTSYPFTDNLCEGKKYLIKIEANDGFNQGTAISKPFSIQSFNKETLEQIIAKK